MMLALHAASSWLPHTAASEIANATLPTATAGNELVTAFLRIQRAAYQAGLHLPDFASCPGVLTVTDPRRAPQVPAAAGPAKAC